MFAKTSIAAYLIIFIVGLDLCTPCLRKINFLPPTQQGHPLKQPGIVQLDLPHPPPPPFLHHFPPKNSSTAPGPEVGKHI